eukprot:TRINITY_DN4259_c1_g1_i2.p1 TRINITY_DN4259_c1_g1~~TRINITY_DN4259_c1_g1_i2.p1  ORF type:complete len:244 (-),score=56.04 TRINITY_DN4259_c1_g1_i2:181-879(-)
MCDVESRNVEENLTKNFDELGVSEQEDPNSDLDEELSDLTVDLLILAQDLVEAKVKLEEVSKNGWMDMAKARYIMGSTAISTLQLPKPEEDSDTGIEPSATVSKQECLRDGSKNVRYYHYSLNPPPSAQDTTSQSKQEAAEGLRQRKQESNNGDGDTKGGSKVEEVKKRPKSLSDPVRWFSAMPPAPLKRSQKYFQSGVEIVLEIANLQSQIRGIQNRIKYLKRMKQKQTEN